MRPDSKRITTRELEDGTVEVRADLTWLERVEGAPESTYIRVRPDLTLEFDPYFGKHHDLRFVGRRRAKQPWRNTANPLEIAAKLWYNSELLMFPKDPLTAAVQQVAHNRYRGRVEYLRRVWNGMLRRALDYADPFVLQTVRRTQPRSEYYNVVVTSPTTERLVEHSPALGVLVAHYARPVHSSNLADAFREFNFGASEAFLRYAERQHFTPRFTPGIGRSGMARIVGNAVYQLATIPPEWLQKLKGADQWAFLNFLLSQDSPTYEEMLWCYLGSDPTAVLRALDAEVARRQHAASVQHKTRTAGRSQAVHHFVYGKLGDAIPEFKQMQRTHRIAQSLTQTDSYDDDADLLPW